MRYYLLNDSRYENHHGCLAVINNLHAAMQQRGAEAVGSLPSGQGPEKLAMDGRLQDADIVLINGGGTLHKDNCNNQRLLASVDYALNQGLPVVLLNALWRENDLTPWLAVLKRLQMIYCRDRRSQRILRDAGVSACYAPDLSFLSHHQPRKQNDCGERYMFTDSINPKLSARLLRAHRKSPGSRFLPMMLNPPVFNDSVEPLAKRLKRKVYPALHRYFAVPVPAFYRALNYSIADQQHYIEQLQNSRAVLAGRYHGICFCLQQGIPWLGFRSWRVEALLEEIGLPAEQFLLDRVPHRGQAMENAFETAIRLEKTFRPQMREFNAQAQQRLNQMFDKICQPVAA